MLKRIFDIAVSGTGLLVLAPILLLVALVVRVSIGSPILFVQKRPGRQGRPFKLVKFRTMNDRRSVNGDLLPDSERLTRAGQMLRSTSLDEIPELWNVFVGNMSLVGPRPLLMEYLPLYSPEQARRHEVRPGVTGWAQVKGRNLLSWDERFGLDVWYVDHQSFWLDIRILFATVGVVFKRKGVAHPGESTMPKFTGNAT